MKFAGPAEKLKITEYGDGILFEVIPQLRTIDFLLASIPACCATASALLVSSLLAKFGLTAFFLMLTSVFIYKDGGALFVSSEGLGDSKQNLIRWESVYRLYTYAGAGDDRVSGLYVEGPSGSLCVLTVGSWNIAEEVLSSIRRRFPSPNFAAQPDVSYPFGLGSGKWGEFITLELNKKEVDHGTHSTR